MLADLKMPRRSDACQACGHAFGGGDRLQALLFEISAGYERRDFCIDCTPPELAAAALATWKTRRPAEVSRKAVPIDREAIHAFFQRLEEDQAPEKRQFRFVLSLLLWRKRVLKLDQADATPEGEVWRFSTVRGDKTYSVARPALDEDQLDQLSQQLEALLAGGALPAAAPEEEASDA